MSIRRVEPTRTAAASTFAPPRSTISTYSGVEAVQLRARGGDGIVARPNASRRRERARQGERCSRSAARGARCATTARARRGRARSAGRGSRVEVQVAHEPPDDRACCASFWPKYARRGRTMLKSLRQTVATPRKWPGRASPSAPSVARRRPTCRSRRDTSPHASARTARRRRRLGDRRVARLVARVRGEIGLLVELRRIDEERRDDGLVLGACGAEERAVAVVQRAHRRHEPDLAGEPATRAIARTIFMSRAPASRRRASRRGARAPALLADRRAVRVDRRPVAARDRPGQLEAVLDRAAHQRLERLRRGAGRVEEQRRRALKRDDVVRREDGARVVERARRVGEIERAEPERLGERNPSRAPRRSRP